MEERYWSRHKLLYRAFHYAVPPLADQLQAARDMVLTTINGWITASKERDAKNEEEVRQKYVQHLIETDRKLVQQSQIERRKKEVRAMLNKETCLEPNKFYARSKKEKPEKWKKYEETRAKRRKYQDAGEPLGFAMTMFFLANAVCSILLLLEIDVTFALLEVITMVWLVSTAMFIMFVTKPGCISFFIILFIIGFIVQLLGNWIWIAFIITALISIGAVIGEMKTSSSQRKLNNIINEEYILMRELVNDHKAYVAKIQEIYIPDLGNDEVNYAIKMVVDAYPDEDFKENLIDEIYPKIGYKRPENKEK